MSHRRHAFWGKKIDKRILEFIVLTLISCVSLLPIMASAQGAAIRLQAKDPSMAASKTFSSQSQALAIIAFSDVDVSHPLNKTITEARSRGFVSGNLDGTFAPDRSINRAELVTMVIASLIKNPQGANCFTDVHDEWFASRVCEAKRRGLVSGYPDGTFQPFNNINFAEAAQIITKAHGVLIPLENQSESWFASAVQSLTNLKAIPSTIDRVDEKISRAETAELIFRVVSPDASRSTKSLANLTAPLPTISSCIELSDKVTMLRYKNSIANKNTRTMILEFDAAARLQVNDESESADAAAGSTAQPDAAPPMAKSEAGALSNNESGGSGGAADYSTTNVQVAGVDEADVIKNDGEFIYMVSGKTVRIVKAYQPSEMSQVSKLELSDKNFTPTEIYAYGNKLVVLGTTNYTTAEQSTENGAVNSRAKMMIYPPYYRSRAKVFVIDMSNKANLREERSVEFDGQTLSSRRINDHIYLVVNKTPEYQIMYSPTSEIISPEEIQNLIPMYKDSRLAKDMPVAGCASVHFVPDFEQINFMTIASINVVNPAAPIRKEVVMGGGENIYASTNNLYVASTRYEYPAVGLFDTIVGVAAEEKTRITQLQLKGGDIVVGTVGEVPGRLLNQFSMDEDSDSFRVATTIGQRWSGRGPTTRSTNNIYILNRSNLAEQLGALKNLAPGETIYSVRFLGDRAYMVTFKKIDPFFVLDLSDDRNPRVLGELKIPGYSDYLHPIDDTHILGFGKDAIDPSELERSRIGWWNDTMDFAWYQGMKVAVFDVTDVKNPKLQHNLIIGDRGTESELLHNHKALFYDKTRGLIAFPVTVHQIKDKSQGNDSTGGAAYGDPVFQGAYVLKLDLGKSFEVVGRITHVPASAWESSNYLPYDQSQLFIQRILSIGNYLYTVSLGRIRASDITNFEEIKSLDLDYDNNQGGWGWIE